MHTEDHIIHRLKEKGHRMTSGRKWFIKIFINNTKHLSAQDVHQLLSDKGLDVNLSTVYRELQFFSDEGVIRGVQFADGVQRYELKEEGHHHHLICTKCESAQDIYMDNDLDTLESRIEKENSFSISHHMLDFYGVCGKCK
jgi:Fur family ferric uptake transcriptional regulator